MSDSPGRTQAIVADPEPVIATGSLSDVKTSDPRQQEILLQIESGALDPATLGFREKRDLDILLIQHALAEGKLPATESKALNKKLASLKRTQNPWFNMDEPADFVGVFLFFAILCVLFSLNWRKVLGLVTGGQEQAQWFSQGLLFINVVIWGSIYSVTVVISLLLMAGG
jgi:hypothetical protein